MRRFAPEWVPNLLGRMGMDEDTPLESGMVSKAIEQAQVKVEGYNFDIRKHVVEYDDVMNTHRDLIYTERRKILEGTDLKTNIQEMIEQELEGLFETFAPQGGQPPDVPGLLNELKTFLPLPPQFTERHLSQMSGKELREEILRHAREAYEAKENEMGPDQMRVLERLLMLSIIDRLWVYHLTALDEMRQGAGLHGYGGQDPLVIYKREAHDMWDQLTYHIRQGVVRRIFQVTLSQQGAPGQATPAGRQAQESGPAKQGSPTASPARRATARRAPTASSTKKVGRNEPCPCGSGRKYKKCCGSGIAA
jgi:preprotein translocase subunit SecA